jgi:D-alanyl-D-alanine carboxypeptidase
VADYAKTLGPLGAPVSFKLKNQSNRGGMQFRSYGISAGGKLLNLSVYVTPEGKIEQFLVSEATG